MGIIRAQSNYEQEYKVMVDIDMKAYFDAANHGKLMYFIERKVKDKQVLQFIRNYLTCGILDRGVFEKFEKGTPQGGNLSSLLSNIYLNEFDKLLESRGHKFVRYADNCNIYVRSRRAGHRVMEKSVAFLEGKLKLTVNKEKSAVGSPLRRKFVGFCLMVTKAGVKIHSHQKVKDTIKQKLKKLTKRNRGRSLSLILKEVRQLMKGWLNYYGISEMKKFISELIGWLRRRIRQYIWKQWKLLRTRRENLIRLGIEKQKAYEWSNTRK
jgi:group II intron reverse transcriptase/maturase